MKFIRQTIVFAEIPNETALCFEITGCKHSCKGCHSPELQEDIGNELTLDIVKNTISKNRNYVTCILFMGGDQFKDDLCALLNICRLMGYKTALYTGSKNVDSDILELLNYLKTGPYIELLGSLNSKTTNQVFMDITNNKNLTHLFHDIK